jgi:hypothetical protein
LKIEVESLKRDIDRMDVQGKQVFIFIYKINFEYYFCLKDGSGDELDNDSNESSENGSTRTTTTTIDYYFQLELRISLQA